MKIVMMLKRIARRILRPVLFFKKIQMRPDDSSKKALLDLIGYLDRDELTMVEIGSYRGESAEVFLSSGKVKRLYCVDPWQMYYDDNDGAAFTDMSKVEADFDRRHGTDARVVKVKGTVDTFVNLFADELKNVDLVYIDGLHTYDGVKHDIEMTKQFIRPKVAIAGHDFCPGTWDGSVRAIKESLGVPDAVFADTSWIKIVDA